MLLTIIIASLFVSLASLLGGFLLFKKNLLNPKVVPYLVSFAAGVILTVAFFDLLPEALHHAQEQGNDLNIFVPAFIGVVLFFFLERFLLWFHHHDDDHGHKPTSVLVLVGDSFHNFIDGVVIAASFLADPALGVVTTIAIAAHELPHEIADFSILIHSGLSKTKALFYNFLSSLTALAGAVGGYFFLSTIEEGLPYLLALSAGMFIYIACADLIPELHTDYKKQRRWQQVIPFVLGIVIIYISLTFLHGSN